MEKYKGFKFYFNCRACRKDKYHKKEFLFIEFQKVRNAVVRCQSCGHKTSRRLILLDKQIENYNYHKDFMTLDEKDILESGNGDQ